MNSASGPKLLTESKVYQPALFWRILSYSPFKLFSVFQFMLLLLILLRSESVTSILLLVYQPSLLWRILSYCPFKLFLSF
jgi:hypothetical protein